MKKSSFYRNSSCHYTAIFSHITLLHICHMIYLLKKFKVVSASKMRPSRVSSNIFGRILSGIIQDHAVDKLAANKTFQSFAVKTVDGFQAAKEKAEELGRKAAENPEEVAAVAKEQANTFWTSLKAEISKDLEKLMTESPSNSATNTPKAASGSKSGELR